MQTTNCANGACKKINIIFLFSRIKLVVGDEIDAYALKEEGKSHDEITEILMQRISDLIEKEK